MYGSDGIDFCNELGGDQQDQQRNHQNTGIQQSNFAPGDVHRHVGNIIGTFIEFDEAGPTLEKIEAECKDIT